MPALTVAQAVRLRPPGGVFVRGYLLAPRDDEPRLCTRLEATGACHDALVLDTSSVDFEGAVALESGCCSLGQWSPRPLVVRLRVDGGRRALVLG